MQAIKELEDLRKQAEAIEETLSSEIKNSKDWSRIALGISEIDTIASNMIHDLNELINQRDSIDLKEDEEKRLREYKREAL